MGERIRLAEIVREIEEGLSIKVRWIGMTDRWDLKRAGEMLSDGLRIGRICDGGAEPDGDREPKNEQAIARGA